MKVEWELELKLDLIELTDNIYYTLFCFLKKISSEAYII